MSLKNFLKHWIFVVVVVSAASLVAMAALAAPAHVYAIGGGGYKRFILSLDTSRRYELKFVAGPKITCTFEDESEGPISMPVGRESANDWISNAGRKSLLCETDPNNPASRLQATVVSVERIEE